jgi:hypothetical protein
MMAHAPLDRPQYIAEAKETAPEGAARYNEIATDIVEVMKTERPLFRGPDGKLRTSIIIVSSMLRESGFRRDVDYGLGPHARGDHGNSVCMMQLNIGKGRTARWNIVKDREAWPNDPPDEIQEGWNAQEVLADRQKCIRAGLRVARMSFDHCRFRPQQYWLCGYLSGSCMIAGQESTIRMDLAAKWYQRHKPAFNDLAFQETE